MPIKAVNSPAVTVRFPQSPGCPRRNRNLYSPVGAVEIARKASIHPRSLNALVAADSAVRSTSPAPPALPANLSAVAYLLRHRPDRIEFRDRLVRKLQFRRGEVLAKMRH